MPYFDNPVFGEDPTSLGGLGCGSDCGCRGCRERTAQLSETYVPDDEEEEEPSSPSSVPPSPGSRPPPTARRAAPLAGAFGWGGLGETPPPGGGGAGTRVVFIPGIMGSVLSARVGPLTLPVWGSTAMLTAFTGPVQLAAWRSAMASGNGMNHGGVITPSGLTRIALPAGRTIDPYSTIVSELRSTFGAANVLVFPYDWRLDNLHNGGRLVAAIRARWPDAAANRVTIIAHSMGGLVARAAIELAGGAPLVSRLLTVGTPHLGAPEALTLLANVSNSAMGAFLLGPIGAAAGALVGSLSLMVRGYAGLIQLLPAYDFLLPRGTSSPEAVSASYTRFRSDPFWTGVFGGSLLRSPASTRAVRAVNRALTGGLATLDARLGSTGTRYFTLASTDHDTAVQAREVAGPIVSPIKARCGDGSVPVTSGFLPAGTHITPLFIGSPRVHNDLFNDASVRRLCLTIASGGVPGSPTPAPGCATPPPPRSGLEGAFACPGCVAGEARAAGFAPA
jgi:hypothetical protein